uniref:Rhodanese domain-containing protein n=1 Tax=Amphora coffeiformis TaxID=265554 RepID=A0A7S3LC27_9STRA
MIADGSTAEGAENRILVVDTRSSLDYIHGHIQDALNVPYDLTAQDGKPLYTNGRDKVSTTASDKMADSWMTHLLVNQLVNDFVSTYQDSTIIFYGDDRASDAVQIAQKIGYTHVSILQSSNYEEWLFKHPGMTEMYAPGVVSMDELSGSFVVSGLVNNVNYENVSIRATHHGITYKGGALSRNSLIWANIPPFCFLELLTYLGADPKGNMAKGIDSGDMADWKSKYPDGQRVDYELTWDGADRYYHLDELFDEKPSEFDTTATTTSRRDFTTLGMEPRIGGTRDSNVLWNPGCLYCHYACVCGITSNAKANEDTWFDDGGIYDIIHFPNDDRNYYASRYYAQADRMPGAGKKILIRVKIIKLRGRSPCSQARPK